MCRRVPECGNPAAQLYLLQEAVSAVKSLFRCESADAFSAEAVLCRRSDFCQLKENGCRKYAHHIKTVASGFIFFPISA
jgi:hypothetical protein